MRTNLTSSSYTIAAGNALSGRITRERIIRVNGARVWLTIAGDDHDYWLHDGDLFTLPAGARVVLEADRGASQIEFVRTGKIISTRSRQEDKLPVNCALQPA